MARGKNEVRNLTQSKLRRAFGMIYPGEQPSAYPDKELRRRIVDFYGGSHKDSEIGVAALLETVSGQNEKGKNKSKDTSKLGLTSPANTATGALASPIGQQLSSKDVRQDNQSRTATAAMANAADPSAAVETVFEDAVFQSVPNPLLSVQKMSDRAAGSFDDVTQNTAVPQTKSKRSSRAGCYDYGEDDEDIVKDVKQTTFLLPAERGDPKMGEVRSGMIPFHSDAAEIGSFKQQTAFIQLVFPFTLPYDITPGSTAAMEFAKSQLLQADKVISHCLTADSTGSDLYGNFLGVARFEASCKDKMDIDRLKYQVVELDSRLAGTETRLAGTEASLADTKKRHDEGKAEWVKQHDEDQKRFEELEAQMRDLHPTRRGMRRIRKRCVLDFKRQKSTKSGRSESEDDRKARIEGNGEAHDGNCIADTELCIRKVDMPGLDSDDEGLIEEIYGFTVDQIREVQEDKVLTTFIDMRGSIALDKNLSMEEGKDIFKMIDDFYHQRQLRAVKSASNEELAKGKQLEADAGHEGLVKAIDKKNRMLREEARSRREQALK